MADRVIRLGVIGLSRAFVLMLPTFTADPRVRLVAAADPRPEARAAFSSQFGGRVYADAEALCADPEVEAVYIASPHQFHAQHAIAASRAGKHVLVEKPMAITLAECQAMIAAAQEAGVHLIVGHSHSFDRPIQHARALIDSGSVGAVRMIQALNFTDFLYRPRRPEELDTARGGGVLFSQGAHQIDIVRLLGGGLVRSVRAMTGAWDPSRPTEGAFSALLTFAGGAFATVTYSGYGHFDSDEFMNWHGELGELKDRQRYGTARRALAAGTDDETTLKNARAYGVGTQLGSSAKPHAHQHFGPVLISCEHADLRPLPDGVMVYGDEQRRFDTLPAPDIPRSEVIDELVAVVAGGAVPLHSGAWSMATLEICLAILDSARAGRDVEPVLQVAPGPAMPAGPSPQ